MSRQTKASAQKQPSQQGKDHQQKGEPQSNAKSSDIGAHLNKSDQQYRNEAENLFDKNQANHPQRSKDQQNNHGAANIQTDNTQENKQQKNHHRDGDHKEGHGPRHTIHPQHRDAEIDRIDQENQQAKQQASKSGDSQQQQGKRTYHFTVQYHTHFGESVSLVGSLPALGEWNTWKAIRLTWSEGHVWKGEAEVPAQDFTYKYVIVREGGDVKWEPVNDRIVLASANDDAFVDTWGSSESKRSKRQ